MIETTALGPDGWRLWRELRLAALAEAPDAFGSTLAEWSGAGDTDQRWRARLHGVALNLVLLANGVPVGMVSATAPDNQGHIELISLWVAPATQGQGSETRRSARSWLGPGANTRAATSRFP